MPELARPSAAGAANDSEQQGAEFHGHAKQHQTFARAAREDYQPSKSILAGHVLDRGRHDDHRLQLGRLGHRRHSRRGEPPPGDVARGELASAICVERFKAAPECGGKLVEFNAIPDTYKRRQFVEAGGWATMPGQTTPDNSVWKAAQLRSQRPLERVRKKRSQHHVEEQDR